jgi:protein involved in polysaccharide export with SLBB domain
MQELQRHQPEATRATLATSPPTTRAIGSGVRTGGDEGSDGDGTVQVTWGALIQELDVAGMTVGEVQAEVQDAYNMAPGIRVNVNGSEADLDTVLATGDALEFVRAAGEKGGR